MPSQNQVGRDELIRLFVLSEVSDDYEEPEHIQQKIEARAQLLGINIESSDVAKSLSYLVLNGLVKAYQLSTNDPVVEIDGMPDAQNLRSSYFWITDKGRELLQDSRALWPFDDEGELLSGWTNEG